jgi:hypothetical protein
MMAQPKEQQQQQPKELDGMIKVITQMEQENRDKEKMIEALKDKMRQMA